MLYREHATSTYRFALHFCGSPADAEDLVQTAFLEAHRKLLRGEELVNPRGWLASVVRTRALNLRRDSHDIALGDRLEQLATAVDPGEHSDDLARVRAILWSLPEAQHQAFVLRHWCDVSNREIAQVLGTTESAVESLLVRARKAVAGAADLAPACVDVRDRLARGLPETPRARTHLGDCRSCRAASERVTRAAAVASALALAPPLSVAHALAATVPGFTTAAASTTGAGIAGATATKALLTKTVITTVAIATTATAIHAGALHIPMLHHSGAASARAAGGPPAAAIPASITPSAPVAARHTAPGSSANLPPSASRRPDHHPGSGRDGAHGGPGRDTQGGSGDSQQQPTGNDGNGGSSGGSQDQNQPSAGDSSGSGDQGSTGGSTDGSGTSSGGDGGQGGSSNSPD